MIVWAASFQLVACHSKDIDAALGAPQSGIGGEASEPAPVGNGLQPFRPNLLLPSGGAPNVPARGGNAGNGGVSQTGGAASGGTQAMAGGSAGVSTGGTGGGPNVSQFCGDGIRDPLLEECDDGPGIDEDLCSPDCRARVLVLAQPAGVGSQHFGRSPHVSSANAEGFGVVYTQGTLERVFLARFEPSGGRLGMPIEVSLGASPAGDSNPVVAALPAGKFAVAWADRAGGTPDIVLRIVGADGQMGALIPVNNKIMGSQIDPDLLWTGSELIVGWTDDFDLSQRRFDGTGAPIADEEVLSGSAAFESSVVFAPFGAGHAEAWRSGSEGREVMVVHANGSLWTTEPKYFGPAGGRPALVELDAERLLLVFIEGTDPYELGVPNVGRLRAAILDRASPGPVTSFPFLPLVEPYASDVRLNQQRPGLARVGGKVFLTWQSESPLGDAEGEEVWLSEIDWASADPSTLVRHPELPLGITTLREGDQGAPALGVSPLFPGGALITTFEDVGSGGSNRLLVGLRPAPILLLNPAVLNH